MTRIENGGRVNTEYGIGTIVGLEGIYGQLSKPEKRYVVKLDTCPEEKKEMYPNGELCFFEREIQHLTTAST